MAAVETERFRDLIQRRLGLQFGDDKTDFLEAVLARRAQETGAEPSAYLRGLSQDGPQPAEWGALAEGLTVTETFFFRNPDQFKALVSAVLPGHSGKNGPRLRLLSAACASGEEPYSLAMALKEHCPDPPPGAWSIQAVDVNPAMLSAAAEGAYSHWALRETREDLRDRYFRAEGRKFRVRDDIRASVRFERRNLADANDDLWRAGAFDVVFCRNLLMYLSPEAASLLVARIARALAPGGHLFLGHAETLRGLSQDFRLCHTHGTFYYRRLSENEAQENRADPEAWIRPAAEVPRFVPAAWDGAAPWMEAIRLSLGRVEALSAVSQRKAQAGGGASSAGETRPRDLAPTLDLLGRERFTEALESLERLTLGLEPDGDAQLLGAMLLAHLGRLEEARDACARLLKRDAFNAGAHYVLALCHEQAGDAAAAAEADRSAVYLDPGFALPLLHLGLLVRREEPWRSRAYLEQALQLLAREDTARVLLFGGGFTRQGLMQICRNALSAEGAPQ